MAFQYRKYYGYKKVKIPAALRNSVWNTYIGVDKKLGFCCCCEHTQIDAFNFACGHVIAEKNGGETNLQNLRPICTSCNSSMGKQNMEEFKKKYGLGKKSTANLEGKVETNQGEPYKTYKYVGDCSHCDGIYCIDGIYPNSVIHQLTKDGNYVGECPKNTKKVSPHINAQHKDGKCILCGEGLPLSKHVKPGIISNSCSIATEMLRRAYEWPCHPDKHLVILDELYAVPRLRKPEEIEEAKDDES